MPSQPEPSKPSKYLTTAEAADILRLTPWQVINLCRDKKVRATKPFGKWLIERDSIDEAIEAGYRRDAEGAA